MNKTGWSGIVFLAIVGMGLVGSAYSANGNGNGGDNGNGNGNAFGKAKASAANLSSWLPGSTVCVGSAPNWESQEQHHGSPGQTSGELWEYARGPGHGTDPSSRIGTWSINDAASTVTYSYHGGSFTYTVEDNGGGSVTFTGPSTINATIRTGLVGC